MSFTALGQLTVNVIGMNGVNKITYCKCYWYDLC